MNDIEDRKDWFVELIVDTMSDAGDINPEDSEKVLSYIKSTKLAEDILDILEKWSV